MKRFQFKWGVGQWQERKSYLRYQHCPVKTVGSAHGIVTKTVHKTLPGVVGVKVVGSGRLGLGGGQGGGGGIGSNAV